MERAWPDSPVSLLPPQGQCWLTGHWLRWSWNLLAGSSGLDGWASARPCGGGQPGWVGRAPVYFMPVVRWVFAAPIDHQRGLGCLPGSGVGNMPGSGGVASVCSWGWRSGSGLAPAQPRAEPLPFVG